METMVSVQDGPPVELAGLPGALLLRDTGSLSHPPEHLPVLRPYLSHRRKNTVQTLCTLWTTLL